MARSKHIAFVEMSGTGAGERCLSYARERGYRTTLFTAPESARDATIDSATELVECDVDDDDVLIDRVTTVTARDPIDGVTTTHDLYVPQAALVAKRLGLPGMSRLAASQVRNKYLMRRALDTARPDLNPRFELVHTEDEAVATAERWGFPLIAKPPDANDSWQVRRIDTAAGLREYIRAAQTWPGHPKGERASCGVLLETYLVGAEFTVDTIQHADGSVTLMGVGVKEWGVADEASFPERAIYFPLDDDGLTERLFNDVAAALRALRITYGVIHTECRVVDGQTKILEVNPRLAGDLLGSHAIELATGASPVEQVVEIAFGNSPPWVPPHRRGSAIIGVSGPPDGSPFRGFANLDELRACEGVEHIKVNADLGVHVRYPPRSNRDYVARLVTVADTPHAALSLAEQATAKATLR